MDGAAADAGSRSGMAQGKLISADSTLRAVQTAVHASPEGLVLVEHSRADTPLEALVARIRPSLVLLVRHEGLPPSPRQPAQGWADRLTDVDAHQAYELRTLEALGEEAPQVPAGRGWNPRRRHELPL